MARMGSPVHLRPCTEAAVVWGDDLADSARDGRLQPPIGNVGERLLEAGVGADEFAVAEVAAMGAA
jgi:hypothetical protein